MKNLSIIIDILEAYTVDVPAAFTPNGDGVNDVVYIRDQKPDGDIVFCTRTCSAVLSASPDIVREQGVKIELEAEIVLDGVTYASGTKLTVDKELNWIEVSDWN